MSLNFLVFPTSGGISSRLAPFLFLIFLSTTSSSCVYYPRLMSSWLLMIFVIGSSITSGDFPSRFLKCRFQRYIRSSYLTTLGLVPAVLFIRLTSFTACYAIRDCLSSAGSLIFIIG